MIDTTVSSSREAAGNYTRVGGKQSEGDDADQTHYSEQRATKKSSRGVFNRFMNRQSKADKYQRVYNSQSFEGGDEGSLKTPGGEEGEKKQDGDHEDKNVGARSTFIKRHSMVNGSQILREVKGPKCCYCFNYNCGFIIFGLTDFLVFIMLSIRMFYAVRDKYWHHKDMDDDDLKDLSQHEQDQLNLANYQRIISIVMWFVVMPQSMAFICALGMDTVMSRTVHFYVLIIRLIIQAACIPLVILLNAEQIVEQFKLKDWTESKDLLKSSTVVKLGLILIFMVFQALICQQTYVTQVLLQQKIQLECYLHMDVKSEFNQRKRQIEYEFDDRRSILKQMLEKFDEVSGPNLGTTKSIVQANKEKFAEEEDEQPSGYAIN